ncbi:MAG: SRPBCC family protein [Hyphomicrobium sp.]|nr:SRPBCC family protein [Hyphomicrobium sp.]
MVKVATAAAISVLALTAANPVEAASLVSAKKLEIDVPAEKVEAERAALWEKIGGWCAISEWHPAVEKCEATKEGDAEFRTLTLKSGGVIKERLLERGTATYKYEIIESPLPVTNYNAQFSVTPDDDDLDEMNVVWSATYDAKGAEDKEARKTIDGIFKDGMDSIKSKYGAEK